MLITSIGSGSLVGRTGRYKIFPVAGTAIMAVGFVLLSRMDAATPTWQQSVFLFVLGAGIGLCMQVLVLIVQNTASFADLGVATSGVTFFRTIGSSFGAAIFGSLFTNFLTGRLADALRVSGAPAQAAQSPKALHQLTPEMAEPIITAYADSLGTVFLCAAPVALVGFVVSLFLKEVPLRQLEAISPTDIGEGFGMPAGESSEKMLEVAVGRMFRDSPEIRLRSLATQPGSRLDVALLWALMQIYRHDRVFGAAGITAIAERLRVPHDVIEPIVNRLVDRGFAWRTGDRLGLTPTGMRQVNAIRMTVVERLTHKLAQSPSFEGQPDRAKVDAALDRIAGRMLLQREWFDDREVVADGRRLPSPNEPNR